MHKGSSSKDDGNHRSRNQPRRDQGRSSNSQHQIPSTSRSEDEENNPHQRRHHTETGSTRDDQRREPFRVEPVNCNRNTAGNNKKPDPKRPPNSPPCKAKPDKRIRADSKGEPKKRRDRYEIVKTKPLSIMTKQGESGSPIKLRANFFRLIERPSFELVQYRVDFNPECDTATKKYLMYTQREFLNGYLYDTQNSVYLTHRLSINDDAVHHLDCEDRKKNNFQVTLKFASTIAMDTRESLQVLNLILRRAMDGLKLQLVGRNLFDAIAAVDLYNFDLHIWPGYITSIRQHENSILLCAEISSKIMRNETVYNIWQQCGRDRIAFTTKVLGIVVLTDYNNKTYRVHDLDFDSTLSSFTFLHKKFGTISLVEYYKRKHDKTINDRSQPLLISRSTKILPDGSPEHILLIPELCRPTGLTETQRSDHRLMGSLSRYTRLNPDARMERLANFNERLNETAASKDILSTWNLELDKELVRIPGRVLIKENILYGNNEKKETSKSSDWQFINKEMYLTYSLKRWAILTPRFMSYKVNTFVQQLNSICRQMKFCVERPHIFTLNSDRNHEYTSAFGDALRIDPQLIMAFVPNNSADRYACIKKMGCITHGIPTQVIAQRTLKNRGNMSIATKVLIQISCKLGGVPWLIHIPTEGLMTVGIDVARDKASENIKWEALVATMCLNLKNVKRESFYSTVTKHNDSEPYSTQLGLNIVKALRCYQEMNNALPKKICVYRDGVGEGQLKDVYECEVKQLEEKLKAIYAEKDAELKLCFIVVSKRINTRIFAQNENPPPGTIVDDVITLPERYDFYLVSQSVRQGTVSPTSYNVLYDTMGLSADRLQSLTYKQTHLYYNWFGTVRVPAVCQYAHKLTFLVAQCLHELPRTALEKKLYFL